MTDSFTMPSWRYGRRFRRYRKYRRFYRRYRRSYARKFVNASSKSNVRMKTAVEASATISVPYNGLSSVYNIPAFGSSSATINARSVLASPLYRTYCSLYEEVKCIGMKVVVSVATPIGGTSLPSLQIYTAWDRRHGYTEASYSADDIKNSSTYNVSTALNNNVAKLTRSVYASDLMEKAQWHDCTLSTAAGNHQDDAYVAAAANPNFFAPTLFMTFASPSLAQQQSPATVALQFSIVYYMAFRNPKYGAGASSAKLADLGGRIVEPQVRRDDGDMDDDPPANAPDGDDGDMDDDPPAGGDVDYAPQNPVPKQSRSSAMIQAKRVRERINPGPVRNPPKN